MIEINSISFSRGGHQLYSQFTEKLEIGESVLLTGPNGSGKSTLIGLIGGLLKPDSGIIRINEKRVTDLSASEQASLRSIAPQRRTFTLAFTVGEVLEFLPKKRRIKDNSYLFAQLGVLDLLEKKVTELSIGQQERVSLALALSQRADYYLLDEPFSAQDSDSSGRILEIISELRKEKGVLVISHNQDAFSNSFDRVISLV